MALTPSAISKAVSRLEGDLGVTLLRRTSRSVEPTDEGLAFFEEIKPLIDAAWDARDAVASRHGKVRGRVRIGLPVSYGEFVFPGIADRVMTTYPDLVIETVLADRYPDLIADRLDMAVVSGEPKDARIVARLLSQHPFVTVGSPEYLEHSGMPQSPEDLSNHRCLAYVSANTGTYKVWSYEQEERRIRYQPEPAFVTDHVHALLELVCRGHGLVHVPAYAAAADLRAGRLVPLLVDWTSLGPPIYLIYPLRTQLPRRAQVVLDEILSIHLA